MTVSAVDNRLQPFVGTVQAQPESNWIATARVIGQVALQIFIPFTAAFLLYLVVPASISALVLPIGTLSIAFAVSFLFAGNGSFPIARPEAIPPLHTPRGIRNGGMNCWINSLAQVIRCDEGLSSWFLSLPDQWEGFRQIPFLPPAISSRLSHNDAILPAALNPLFANDEMPDLYLQTVHPKLQAYLENRNQNTFLEARSYYKKYCGNFAGNEDEFHQLLSDPQFGENRYVQDREGIQAYFQRIQEVPNALRYFLFFAEIPPLERLNVWNAMAEFHNFLNAYEEAEERNVALVDFSSQKLRLALSHVSAMIHPSVGNQEDPMEAMNLIGDSLMPKDLKVSVEARKTYILGENPPMEGGAMVTKREGLQLGCMQVDLFNAHPTLQEMVDRGESQVNQNPQLLVKQQGVDGLTHEYLVDREERHFTTAPAALWFHVKRMKNVVASPWECLQRLLPNWFPRLHVGLQKVETSIDAGDVISIQSPLGERIEYQLDSFIVHRGASLNSGHYISYKRVQVDENRWAWFEMNDSRVRELTAPQAAEIREEAYIYHASLIA